jgi:stage II sporulation protein D (peptidoglycan lytic transglycosylase)
LPLAAPARMIQYQGRDAMARIRIRIGRSLSRLLRPAAHSVLPGLLLFVGCSTSLNRNIAATNPPIMRVRLLQSLDQIAVVASEPPLYRTESDPTPRLLGLPKNMPILIALTPAGWRVGNTTLGSGNLTIQPTTEGSVGIQQLSGPNPDPRPRPYRGLYKFVPVATTKFDVVNEVDIDGYLAGVLPRELFRNWHDETYKAQAIIARTYALYSKAVDGNASNRYWDVFADERSQVYGGMLDETDKSRLAVNQTQGIVVAYGAGGQEPRIFKAYFSSCCGGISANVYDAFGEYPIEPLHDQNNNAICNASPRFNWGPVVIGKEELTRRIRAWGKYKNLPERDMVTLKDAALLKVNAWGRPAQFVITDARNNKYRLLAEEFRSACNWDANNPQYAPKDHAPPPILYSSFVKVITDAESIRFVEGHGFGHGVGMCQWCSERRAEEGMRHEDIVLAAYPHAQLVRAY